MAARKKQKTCANGNSPVRPASAASVPSAGNTTPPSSLQKCLLAFAVLVEVFWVAALVTMALGK
ncbi:MAG: hypothetical protein RBS80_12745 [Thermoguttaceae bacterium]|jgi:hypothetical protein|nr:hypothetical protein [Thermoguttaceae bacterium]